MDGRIDNREKAGRVLFLVFAVMFLAGFGWGVTWLLNVFGGFGISYAYAGITGAVSGGLSLIVLCIERLLAYRKFKRQNKNPDNPLGIGGATYPTELTEAQRRELDYHQSLTADEREGISIVAKTVHYFLLTMVVAGGMGGLFWVLSYYGILSLPYAIPGIVSCASMATGLFGFLYEKLVVRK